MSRTFRPSTVLLLIAVFALARCSSMKGTSDGQQVEESPLEDRVQDPEETSHETSHATSHDAWQSLFDGESLAGWEVVKFGGDGPVRVEEGVLVLSMGDPMTGVRWERPFPKMDYVIELEAQRVEGTDFFCGLTFPVAESCASLILGGWGGWTCGISSLEDMDASENETTFDRSFEMNRWYSVKLRVTARKIEAWIDGEQVVDVETTGRRIGTRPEIDLCRPLGLASYLTTAALRNIRWRPVP